MLPSCCVFSACLRSCVCVCESIHYLISMRVYLSGRQESTGRRGTSANKNRAWPAAGARLWLSLFICSAEVHYHEAEKKESGRNAFQVAR